jgi:hypothetical protein
MYSAEGFHVALGAPGTNLYCLMVVRIVLRLIKLRISDMYSFVGYSTRVVLEELN